MANKIEAVLVVVVQWFERGPVEQLWSADPEPEDPMCVIEPVFVDVFLVLDGEPRHVDGECRLEAVYGFLAWEKLPAQRGGGNNIND